jgi:lipoic acid synthetase
MGLDGPWSSRHHRHGYSLSMDGQPTLLPIVRDCREFRARWLGRVHYEEAYDLQRELRLARELDCVPDYVLLLEHPHVYTLGRRFRKEHMPFAPEFYEALGARIVETDRGGSITYHGPGQLVAYPIVKLAKPDVIAYIRALEEAVILLLSDLGIEGSRNEANAGVWVGDKKICAVGVRVSRSVTMHGLALNVSTDLSFFSKIYPCGLANFGVTSIRAELGDAPPVAELAEPLARRLAEVLGEPTPSFVAVADGFGGRPSGSGTVRLSVQTSPAGGSCGSSEDVSTSADLSPPGDGCSLPNVRGGVEERRPSSSSGRLPQRPSYLRVRARMGKEFFSMKKLMRTLDLHTVCEEAACPNIYECWGEGTATIMILGDVCTRSCGFCNVATGRPVWDDPGEPERVARAISSMGVSHAVITSVARDDLSDGGAGAFARTIEALKRLAPGVSIEVLIPDFKGSRNALASVVDARPDVLAHNVETVARLQRKVRGGTAGYARSLAVLARAKQLDRSLATKSGIMVGLGETVDEVVRCLEDLRAVGVDIITIGQYLQPSRRHLPVVRWWELDEFRELEAVAYRLGFSHVESGPLVRSSYHAKRALDAVRNERFDRPVVESRPA